MDFDVSVTGIKLLPLVVPLLIAIWDLRNDKKKKTFTQRVVRPMALILATAASGTIVVLDAKKTRAVEIATAEEKAGAVRRQAEADKQMNRIEGRLGSEDATQRYIRGVRELSNRYLAEKTSEAAAKYFGSEEQRRKLREETIQANKEVLAAASVRYDPICGMIADKFDQWMAELKKGGLKIETKTEDQKGVIIEPPSNFVLIRSATFADKSELRLMVLPAAVEDGKITRDMLVDLSGDLRGVGATLFRVEVNQDTCNLMNLNEAKYAFKSQNWPAKNPIEDEKITKAISSALDEIVIHFVTKATAAK